MNSRDPYTSPYDNNTAPENLSVVAFLNDCNEQQLISSQAIQQDYQLNSLNSSTLSNHSTDAIKMTDYSFFYNPPNDFQIYGVTCKEMPISFEFVSQILNNIDDNNMPHLQSNLFVFYFQQYHDKKIYQVTCKMVSHTFITNLLNKEIHGLDFSQIEQQQQVFSKRHQRNLKLHLKQFLDNHLKPKEVHKQNCDLNMNIPSNSPTISNNGINGASSTPVAPIDIDPTTQLQQYIGDNITFNPSTTIFQDNSNRYVDS